MNCEKERNEYRRSGKKGERKELKERRRTEKGE